MSKTRRKVWKWLPGILVLVVVLALPSAASAVGGCTWENCWVCATAPWGGDSLCTAANSQDGRMCCTEYNQGGTFACRIYDDFCYGIIVRDI